jgi:DEAD/DEAH box helicase domain-containing protein
MFGSVEVTDTLTGYREYDEKTGELVEDHPYETNSVKTFRTDACWLSVDRRIGVKPDEVYRELHSLEHATRAIVPLTVPCDPFDLSGLTMREGPLGEPAFYLYDAVAGGIGIAEAVSQDLPRMLAAARVLLEGCSCDSSCPRCIQITRCTEDNERLDRHSGLRLLEALAGLVDRESKIFDPSTMQWL